MLILCQGYFSRTLSNIFSLYFGKLETAIFKEKLSGAAFENNYVSNTIGTIFRFHALLVSKRFQTGKKKGTTSF